MPLQRVKKRRYWSRRKKKVVRNLAVALVLVIVAGAAFSFLRSEGMLPAFETDDAWYEVSKSDLLKVKLPLDDAPHDNYTEWWYYNGLMQTQDGKKFAFHFTIFQIRAMATHTVIHASFLDIASGRHFTYQKRTGGEPSTPRENGFDFVMGDWQMSGSDGDDTLIGRTEDFSFNLRLKNSAPLVYQGGDGLLDFKEAGTSYYYSRPRMDITGTAGVDGRTQQVSGTAWFDHQWGDFRTTLLDWDWFALQLDDGADVMVYLLYTPTGEIVLASGTYTKEGITTVLGADDIVALPKRLWKSPKTGINYPIEWVINFPSKKLEVTANALVSASEFDGRDSTYTTYWEGPIRISGEVSGKGYMELNRSQRR